jgi:hypothetical protein
VFEDDAGDAMQMMTLDPYGNSAGCEKSVGNMW